MLLSSNYCKLRTVFYYAGLAASIWGTLFRAHGQVIKADSVDWIEADLEQIGVNQGLSQGLITGIGLDSTGYLWAGTPDGLNRYDGMGFTIFRPESGRPNSIGGSYVHRILVDSRDRVWALVPPFGLSLFVRETESFVHFRHQAGVRNGLATDQPEEIFEDHKGNIFITGPLGTRITCLSQKPGTTGSSVSDFQIRSMEEVYPQFGMRENQVAGRISLAFEKNGGFWVFSDQTYFFPPGMRKGEPPLVFGRASRPPGNCDPMGRIIVDANGIHAYRIESTTLLSRFQEKEKKFVPYLQLPESYPICKFSWIDRRSQLWSWAPENKLLRTDLITGKMTVIQTRKSKLEPALHQQFASFGSYPVVDQNGNFWTGSSGFGLVKIPALSGRFRLIRNEENVEHLKRIKRFSSATNHASLEPELLQKTAGWLPALLGPEKENCSVYICPITVTKAGNLLTSMHCRPEQFKINELEMPSGKNHTLVSIPMSPGYPMNHVLFVDPDDNVWFGDRQTPAGYQIYRWVRAANRIDTFHLGPKGERIYDWHWAKGGILWLASRSGLIRLDQKSGKFRTFWHSENLPASVASNSILCLCPDPDEPERFLWLGTSDRGMDRFEIRTGRCIHFTTRNGLPNNKVYAIQSDARKNLWLSTNLGICHFILKTGATTHFSAKDGLISNEFNVFEFAKNADGRLFFGTPTGMVSFQPEDFYRPTPPSEVVFTELRVLNKPVPLPSEGTEGLALEQPIEQTGHLVFTHKESMITLGFALLDLTNPEVNRFRYKMEGFDKDWIDAGTAHEATYTNLPPGEFTFKVLGCNSRKVWNKEPKSITITILPPWWGTWWFRTLVVVCVSGLLYVFYRFRLQQALNMMRLRDKIALDLHDEIGSSLNSIAFFGEAAKRMLPEDAQANQVISRINDKSKEIMESMSDIVWSLNSRNDSFDNIFNRLRSFAVQVLEPRNCEVVFDLPSKLDDLKMGMEERKNLYLLVKEAINNAAKYADCSRLTVTIEKQKNGLRIEVRDNGKGFDVQEVAKGNGLLNMKKRAEELKANFTLISNTGMGTRIVVNL